MLTVSRTWLKSLKHLFAHSNRKSYPLHLKKQISKSLLYSFSATDNATTTTTIRSTTGCHDGTGGGSCCKPSKQCLEGEGDCDENNDCIGNLLCGVDNCDQRLGFSAYSDCCYDPNRK